MPDDLVAFLRARIAEVQDGWAREVYEQNRDLALYLLGVVQVKRWILDEHAPTPTGSGVDGEFHCSICLQPGDIADEHPDNWYPQRHPCKTVRLLAYAWSDHPNYREEWKP